MGNCDQQVLLLTSIFNTNSSPYLKSKNLVMKMFIAFSLLIATVTALPMDTAERSTKQLVAEPEGAAADALSAISQTVLDITTTDLDALATKVGGIETDVPAAVTALVNALAAAA